MAADVQSAAVVDGPLYIDNSANPRSGSCTGQYRSGIAQKGRSAVMDARPFPRPDSDPQPPRIISGCGK
jgi:hypothetical protein